MFLLQENAHREKVWDENVKLYSIRHVLFWKVDSWLWFTSSTSDSDKWRDRVYTLTCITCEQTYVRQTNRSLKLRHQEHIRYIKNNNPQSAYALHILQNRHKCGPMNEMMHLLKTHQKYLITNPLWTTLRTISPSRKETNSRTKPRRSKPSVLSGHWPSPPPSMTKPVAQHHPNCTHDLHSGSQDHQPSTNWDMYNLFKSLTWINILITPHDLSPQPT